jgi:ABC-2 type transport system ATP-binding protein
MAEPVVSVEGLVKRYGEVTAIDGVSFEVQKGEIFALLGPNGAGKTTAIEILECTRQPTAGSVKVLGHSVTASHGANEVKKRIGVLPQEFGALGRLTVAENLEFFARMYDKSVDAMSPLDLLEIRDKANTRFANLSRGLKQRVGIAAALVNDPELILLDEPTTGLSSEIRRATWKVIGDLRTKGKTTILTTHYVEEAEQLADRIGILYKGKILALDTPAGLLGKFGGGRTIIFRNGGDAVFGTLRRFFDAVSMEGSDVVLPFDRFRDLEVALTALVGRGLEAEVALRSPTVEDVFLRLAGVEMSDTGEAN